MSPVFTLASGRGATLLVLALSLSFIISAQTTWTGAQDSLFSDTDNWSNGLPAEGNPATVPGGARVVIAQQLTGDFDLQSFGELVQRARVDVIGDWQLSGSFSIRRDRLTIRGDLMNFGSVDIGAGGSVFVTRQGRFRSNGTIESAGKVAVRGTFRNEGSVIVANEAEFSSIGSGLFENPGVIEVFGRLDIKKGGDYTAPSGGTIEVKSDGLLRNRSGATITNAGIIRVGANGRFEQDANFDNNPGRAFVSGTLVTGAGSVTSVNFLTVEQGGLLDVMDSERFEVAFSLLNFGTVRLHRAATVRGLVTNGPDGQFTVESGGSLDFVVGTNLTNEGAFANFGVINSVGTLTNVGTFDNSGAIQQDGSGSIVNDSTFVNSDIITSIDQIVNNAVFRNEGRIINGSGGLVLNNDRFSNAEGAVIENQFNVVNRSRFVNRGLFENGVSLFNQGELFNEGKIDNVGDVINEATGAILNLGPGVINNSRTGILTNNGLVENDGVVGNLRCAIIANNQQLKNRGNLRNEGLFFENGFVSGAPIVGPGVVVEDGGTASEICAPVVVSLDPDGESTVGGTLFGAVPFDSCQGIIYLVNDEEAIEVTCADIGTQEVTLTLRDRRGNEVSCLTTLTVVDDRQPKPDFCQDDIEVTVDALPAIVDFRAPIFSDNCDPAPEVTSNKQPGDPFDEGSTVVTYRAVDDSGNEFVCEFTVRVSLTVAEQDCAPKDPDGLIAYYNFAKQTGELVYDRAGRGNPLHLRIKNVNYVTPGEGCGLVNDGRALVKSVHPASDLAERVAVTDAVTVEVWVRADALQSGPARVVTLSDNVTSRNFTLGQDGDRWVFRLKTTHTDDNGMPNRLAASGSVVIGQLQHVVFTHAADGRERFYVDGRLVYSGRRGGQLSNWSKHSHLALFDEVTGHRNFRGAIKKVAVYDRALSAEEVAVERALGACCDGDDSPLGSICEGPRGRVSYERYDGIGGDHLAQLFKSASFPAQPAARLKLKSLELPTHVGDDYGTRTRGWLYPAVSGAYRLAITGDNETKLLLSHVAGEAGFAEVIASVDGWANPGDLEKYPTQKSEHVQLLRGEAYYFELLHKEGRRSDHATVFWQEPGSTRFETIGEAHLGDVELCEVSEPPLSDCDETRGGLLHEVWMQLDGLGLDALLNDPRYPNDPTASDTTTSLDGPSDTGTEYGSRVRGYLHVEETGAYEFVVTGDDQTRLILSPNDDPARGRVIASTPGWTRDREFDKYASQTSGLINLVAGRRYYVELLHEQGQGAGFFHVRWQSPSLTNYQDVPRAQLSPFLDCDGAGDVSASCGKNVLLVVGSKRLSDGDAAVKRELKAAGYQVTVEDLAGATVANARTRDLVMVSSSVNSDDLGPRFRELPTPMIVHEPYLFDDLRMTQGLAGIDYGKRHTQRIRVDATEGALSAELSGNVRVSTREEDLSWGRVTGSGAKLVAHQGGARERSHIFVYDHGAQMAGGMQAPAIRIGAPFTNEASAALTADGKKLLRTLVAYATGCELGRGLLTVNPDLLDLSAARVFDGVKLVWTNNTAFKNERFLVERAPADGEYELIATVEPTGEGDAIETYRFDDESPALGDNLYRVRAVFTDSTEASSQLRHVRLYARSHVTVFPNPASESVTVALEDIGGATVELTITDQLGRTVLRRTVEPGTSRLKVDARVFPVGTYSVTIANQRFVNSVRLVIVED